MTSAPPGATPTLTEIADELGKQYRSLERFPGRMTAETIERKKRCLVEAERIIRFLLVHTDGMRKLVEACRMADVHDLDWQDEPSMLDAFRDHPAVKAVIEQIPDIVVSGVRRSRPMLSAPAAAVSIGTSCDDASDD